MHVRFVAADDERRELKFERKVGMGGRTRMLARQVAVYAVPAGRWRLASHLAGCDERIRPGEECTLFVAGHEFTLPSGTYPADWFVVDVPAGGATDAGEINLELPRDTVFGIDASKEEIQVAHSCASLQGACASPGRRRGVAAVPIAPRGTGWSRRRRAPKRPASARPRS
ncbi:hypothetical protein AB5I41_25335 [Sphingomonas sp. MMS24-JH45]